MADERAVLNIASAEGWWAYSIDEDDGRVMSLERLTCFGLIRYEDGTTGVAGLDRTLAADFAPETCGIDMYVWVGPLATEQEARKAAEEQEARDAKLLAEDT